MSSRPECPHCGKYANLTGCFVGECVERNKQAEDRESVKEVFELMRNRTYVQTYGISTAAVENCQNMLEVLKKHFGRVVTKPLKGDRVIVTATGRLDGSIKTYSNAVITDIYDDKVVICMQPYAPFLNGPMWEHKHNETGLKMSVSGGYFGSTNANNLKLTEPQNAWYCFFADGARAGGAVYIECKAVTWTVTTDEFY